MATDFKTAMDEGEKAKAGKAEAKTKKLVGVLTMKIPAIKRVESTEVKEEAMAQAVAAAEDYLAKIGSHLVDLISRARHIRSLGDTERALRREELNDLEAEVLTHLASEEKLFADAARWGYIKALLTVSSPSHPTVKEMISGSKFTSLPGLTALGTGTKDEYILEELAGEAEKGAVTAKLYGVQYRVRTKKDQARWIAETLARLAGDAAKAAKAHYGKESGGLLDQATVKDFQLLASGTPGRYAVEIPDQRDGDKVQPGGTLLAESDGKSVFVLEAVGHFSRVMREIRNAGTRIMVESLSEEKFKAPQRLGQDEFRLSRILHSVVRSGLAIAAENAAKRERSAKFQAECDKEREAYEAEATASAMDWLKNGAVGTALIYLGRKPWVVERREKDKVNRTPHFEVFFLVERLSDDFVRLVKYPERLKPLFRDHFAEPRDPRERFEGLDYPLGAMLKKAYAVVVFGPQGQTNGGDEAPAPEPEPEPES